MSGDHTCLDCAVKLSRRTKGARCRSCANRARTTPLPPVQLCSTGCGTELASDRRRKGTLCRPCNARAIAVSPGRREAVRQAAYRRWADPVERAKLCEAVRRGLDTPEMRAFRSELGKRNGPKTIGNIATPSGHPNRLKAANTARQRLIAMFPGEYRDLYHLLREKQGHHAADAKRMVQDQMARDRAQAAKAPKRPLSFEDQLAAVQAGATLVCKFVAPRPEPMFTLGGATGDINA